METEHRPEMIAVNLNCQQRAVCTCLGPSRAFRDWQKYMLYKTISLVLTVNTEFSFSFKPLPNQWPYKNFLHCEQASLKRGYGALCGGVGGCNSKFFFNVTSYKIYQKLFPD